jgi:hypothetical protein
MPRDRKRTAAGSGREGRLMQLEIFDVGSRGADRWLPGWDSSEGLGGWADLLAPDELGAFHGVEEPSRRADQEGGVGREPQGRPGAWRARATPTRASRLTCCRCPLRPHMALDRGRLVLLKLPLGVHSPPHLTCSRCAGGQSWTLGRPRGLPCPRVSSPRPTSPARPQWQASAALAASDTASPAE